MKRNILDELQDVKSRQQNTLSAEMKNRLDEIQKVIDTINQDNDNKSIELRKYIPISLCSCLEGYVKLAIKELIDNNEQYKKNSKQLSQLKSFKFDLDHIEAINKEKISIGDLISHLLSISKLNDVNTHISIITNKKIFKELKEFRSSIKLAIEGDSEGEYNYRSDSIIKNLNEMYRLRHIYSHELSHGEVPEKEIINNIFNDFKIFIDHLDLYILDLRFPYKKGRPINEIMKDVSDEIDQIKNEVEEYILLVTEQNNRYSWFDHALLDSYFSSKLQLIQKYAELDASPVAGGTMESQLFLGSMLSEYKFVQKELKRKFDNFLGPNPI